MKHVRVFAAAAPLLLVAACAVLDEPASDIRLIEKVERIGDEIVIPYEKYELDNGLTVLLHHDDSDPLVHVDVTYHVGSAREEIGKSGFAHFFEHMMFQGSENVEDDQHFKIVNEAGGTLNGTTNIDRTNYYQTVPRNQLEKILWLEADRMGFLLPAVTQEKFEIQRSTVKNERAQNYENKPYGLQFERTIEALYPQGHPYSWMTIGYVEDLDRVDVDDLKAFFRRWYGPNNATLSIGGDFDREQTLRWVRKYFGSIPRGPAVEPMGKRPVALDGDRYLSMEDKVAAPLLRITLPTVYFGHPDEVALDALSDILAKGTSSLFYRNLRQTGLAASANGSHSCGELACALTFSFMPADGYSIHDMRTGFYETLREFEERGVTDDDLAKIRNAATAQAVFRMQSVGGKVGYLALMETLKGNPNEIAANIARIEALSKADIDRVYRKYLKDRPAVYLRIVPEGERNALETPDEAVFYTSGRTSNEAAFLYQLFVRLYGTNNLPDCSNMCHESSGMGLKEVIGVGKGTVRLEDFEQAELIFVVGQNPGTNHPRMLTTLQKAKRAGARIVHVNPLPETGLKRFRHPQEVFGWLGKGDQLADAFVQVRINGDVAFFKGIQKQLLHEEARRPREVLARRFIKQQTQGLRAFGEDLLGETWEAIVEESGISREQIQHVT
ncbi:MAG: insulinase family protein, partial [Proteobacteria bacterium]|nr:insulinase family protein [Pseudomonadota bacterium]